MAAVSDSLAAADTALSPTVSYLVAKNTVAAGDDTCTLGSPTAALAAKATAYTPLGSKVQIPIQTAGEAVVIEGCKWGVAGEIFGAGGLSGLIQIILQAAGLAPPIAVLFALGTFGSVSSRTWESPDPRSRRDRDRLLAAGDAAERVYPVRERSF